MNFDDYDYHIIQKHRLAVAISVLKTKPVETTLEQHITDLKNKFDDKMDLDITICSDDFNLDDAFDEQINDMNETDDELTECNDLNEYNGDMTQYNETQVTVPDHNESYNSMMLLKDYNRDTANECNVKINDNKENEFSDVIQILKDIGHDKEYDQLHDKNLTQSTYCETLSNFDHSLKGLADNDKTDCETMVHRENEVECNNFHNERHKTQFIENKDILNVVQKDGQYTSNDVNNMRLNERCLTQNKELQNPELNLDNNLTYYDSQATEIYTLHGFTQNYTHVSQSQDCNLNVSEKFITGIPKNLDRSTDSKVMNVNNEILNEKLTDDKSKNLIRNNVSDVNVINMDLTQDIIKLNVNINVTPQTDNFENFSIEEGFIQDYNENAQRDYYSDDYRNIPVVNAITNFNENNETEHSANDINFIENSNFSQNTLSLDQQNLIDKDNKNNNETNILEHRQTDVDFEDISEEELSSQIELVPFKVVEELNKIKTALNRRERKMSYDGSSDSGYKSDSQGRSHRNSLQLSGAWLNQSAHCLYDFITRCPLVGSAQEITGDISQVLGELIDKLHEEEIYPLFLEELLDYHNTLIQEIHTAGTTLLEKDESIQRFLLLNKSAHILKYSIEKLTNILENIHKNLTDEENLYELTNILELENIAYIFHILEVIIKRYLKSKNVIENTQVSQNSDNILKKSSISDIWRRKWNPKFKEEVKTEGGLEKKCVFTKCSEVLNKIVVECMNGYSLVAFAALQCFNLLQS